jgi:hypothetical protein
MPSLPRTVAVVAALVCTLAFAASAQASSLVFIKGGNVWLAQGDGSRQYQVTSDGTATDPYFSPSESDNGTVVAARGSGGPQSLYRMTQNGTLLNRPFQPTSPLGNVIDPRISPDGSTVAYWFVTATNGCNLSGGYCPSADFATAFSYPDHAGSPNNDGLQQGVQEPSWVNNSRVLLSTDSQNEFFGDTGHGDNSYGPSVWWTDCDVFPDDCGSGSFHYPHQMTESRSGTSIAVVRNTGDRPAASSELNLMASNGGPPAQPTDRCDIGQPAGGFYNPTWAPDGSGLAWAEGDGVHVARVGSLDDCSSITGFSDAEIAGASEPFWSVADENPAARSAPSGTAPSKSKRCVVPKLRGKKLKAARKALTKAHCRTGKVKRRKAGKAKRGRVISSSPKAGARRKRNTKVALVVGR